MGGSAVRGTDPHAGELFTGRLAEARAFKAALAHFRSLVDSDREVGVERRNIVGFHGLGGIGKSALSERLEAWVRRDLPLANGWGPPPPTKVDATVRIDLHSSAGRLDLTAVLLALRAGLAGVRTRWPLFDLAFTAYWSAVRPGEALPSFRGNAEYGDVVANTVGEVFKDLGSVADMAVGTPIGVGVWGVRKLVGMIRRRGDMRLGLEAFDGFEEFLLRCADEPSPTEPRPAIACELAATLSWELAGITPSSLIAIFVDTTERLALDPRRASESHLNRLIHAMPNVLFVLTGRDMLDWHDPERADLQFRGPWTWPGLVPGTQEEIRQQAIGNLSPVDAAAFIRRSRRLMDLPMSEAVVEDLVRASAGLPQYLELACQAALSVKNSGGGRQVQVSDVTGSLRSLVMRVLDDVPADEQRAIRAGCLFRSFDTALVAAAANVDQGCAERAVARPMIEVHSDERFPYRLHDAVRNAIRWSDHRVTGGWSERDWETAATRAAVAARQLHDAAKERRNNREILDAIGIAVRLVCDQRTDLEAAPGNTYADWLARAIVYSPSLTGLSTRIPASSRTDYGRHVLNFIAGKSHDKTADERVHLLRGVSEAEHPLRDAACRHLGYTIRRQYRWEEALAVFDDLAARVPTDLNRGQRPQLLGTARRFVDARNAAAGLPVESLVTRIREYVHGRPEQYFLDIGAKLAQLDAAGRQREHLEDVGIHLERRAFFHGDPGVGEVDAFREEAESAGHTVGIRSGLLTTLLMRRCAPEDLSIALRRLKMLDEVSTDTGTFSFRYAFAEFCDAAVVGDGDRLDALRTAVDALTMRGRAWIPVECFLESSGRPVRPIPTQWVEPFTVVRARWATHLHTYLTRHGVADLV
ncbi:ATP/GTP-binding protein [Virgisporangium aliadipatigenens]|uniref:ATP/GTP-binding protein n=1 Tax=Virgisporangium aliadipatigenens TaxID=741659 RepID=A0A8J3YF41_9ACTN|nr:hypothetical protein [Virgisporangium aliadipatigenens]GIJ43999.1 ATP/GTP-binding protein [Virgisporangium aliadipatigenens]